MKTIFKPEIILSLIVFTVLLIIAFNTDTTGDAGDSIVHYLFSHYSLKYPEFFLHHWAKPIFVLFSAPFSQFGFRGMIIFNIFCATLTALFTYYTARSLGIKNAWFVFLIIFFAPLYFVLIFSGLTEYLFGLFLMVGIYLVSKSKYLLALIIVSFLPLIRSEGLLILGVFGLYCLINRKYKLLPYLLTGQLLYTIIGAFYYNDILWVINKIPYANLGSPYGKGELFDFIHRLNYVIEKPIYLLLAIGSISLFYSLFRFGLRKPADTKVILVFGSFITLFAAHALFWWMGIFNSMGLARVLIPTVPLIAIISLIGVQTITNSISNVKIRYSVLTGIALIICIFPFTNRPEGVVYNDKIFVLEENSLIADEVVPFIKKNFPDYASRRIYYSHPYISLALNVDYFDPNAHKETHHALTDQQSDEAIIIWDNWFSIKRGGISLDQVASENSIELMQIFERPDKNRLIKVAVFRTTTAKQ